MKNKMFKIARQMKEEGKDLARGKYVRGEGGEIMVQEEDIKRRWKKYFENLLNESNEHIVEEIVKTEGSIECITKEEIREALRDMKN